MNDNETLFKQTQELLKYDIKEAEEKLLELRRKDENPEKNYLISKLLIEFGVETKEAKYFNEAISKLQRLDNSDFQRVPFYLGTSYLKKYEILEKKPSYLADPEKLLYNSKLQLKKFISKNPNEDLHNAYVNLGAVYSKIGRTIESLKINEFILETYESEYGLYNKGFSLYDYSRYSDNPSLCIKKAYECFKIILEDPKLKVILKEKSKNMIDLILEDYNKEFLEENNEGDGVIEIETEDDFELFIANYCYKNNLNLNLCDFCKECLKSIEDSLVIEKMIYQGAENNEETSFSMLSSYLNQIKMDYVSARTLLILSEYDEIDLDRFIRYVYIIDTDFCEENGIRTQLLKDSFKNFFNILDKIAFFIKDYLKFENEYDKINFRTLWNEPEIKEKLIQKSNPGLTALYDISLDVEYGNEKEYLRKTRNALTHRYLKITSEKREITDKTLEELKSETLEIAHIAKNALIYLMRFVKINEEYREEELDIEFMPIEEVEF